MKQGRCCREKARRGEGSGKGCHEANAPISPFCLRAGLPMGFLPGPSMILPQDVSQVLLTECRPPTSPVHSPQTPPAGRRSLSSLVLSPSVFTQEGLYGSYYSLYVTQISTLQSFSPWLILTSLPSPFTHISWHLLLPENTTESLIAAPGHGRPSLWLTGASGIWSSPSVSPCGVHSLIFCIYGVKSFIITLPASWNFLGQNSLGINGEAVGNNGRTPLLVKVQNQQAE